MYFVTRCCLLVGLSCSAFDRWRRGRSVSSHTARCILLVGTRRSSPPPTTRLFLCHLHLVAPRPTHPCEHKMQKKMSMTQDPTVGWGRSGRAQRSTNGDVSDGDFSGDADGGRGGAGGADLGRESENEDADRWVLVAVCGAVSRVIGCLEGWSTECRVGSGCRTKLCSGLDAGDERCGREAERQTESEKERQRKRCRRYSCTAGVKNLPTAAGGVDASQARTTRVQQNRVAIVFAAADAFVGMAAAVLLACGEISSSLSCGALAWCCSVRQ